MSFITLQSASVLHFKSQIIRPQHVFIIFFQDSSTIFAGSIYHKGFSYNISRSPKFLSCRRFLC